MTLASLEEALPVDCSYNDKKLTIGEVTVEQLDENEFLVDGYSEYVDLPRKFVFGSDIQVVSLLVPFILQALDGVPRI